MKTLVLFRGLPGSGKSTLASQLCKVVFAADDYFIQPDGTYQFDASSIGNAHKQCIANTEVALKHGLNPVGVANTFSQGWEMQPYFDLAAKHGYQISTVIVENRHNSSNSHNVPSEVLKIMAEKFEVKLMETTETTTPARIKAYQVQDTWQTVTLSNSPDDAEYKMCFAETTYGDKVYRAVFAYGFVDRLAKLQSKWSIEEELKFGSFLFNGLVDNSLDKPSTYDVHILHVEGFPLAAEAVSLVADFFEDYISLHEAEKWKTILQFLSN